MASLTMGADGVACHVLNGLDAVVILGDDDVLLSHGVGVGEVHGLLPFLGVVVADGLCTGKTLLSLSTERDVFSGLDFISGFLHELQKLVPVLRCDDAAVDGLLELLLPASALSVNSSFSSLNLSLSFRILSLSFCFTICSACLRIFNDCS